MRRLKRQITRSAWTARRLPCAIVMPVAVMLISLVLFACSKDSTSEQEDVQLPVGFHAELAETTRAVGDGEFGLDNVQLKEQGFGVYCWYTGTADFTTPKKSIYMLMNNQRVDWDGTTEQWTYAPARYWPQEPEEKLTLRAYAPYTDYMFTNTGGMPCLPVVVAAADYRNGTQHDPLWGTSRHGGSDDEDPVYGTLYDNYTHAMSGTQLAKDNRDGIIDWYFHHGMAKLMFVGMVLSDYTPADPAHYKLRITSITLTPLYDQGLLNISSSTATDKNDKPVWEDRSGTMTVTLEGDDLLDANLYNAAHEYVAITDKGLLIIPRDFTNTQPMQLTITYVTENPTAAEKTVTGIVPQSLYGNTVYTIHLQMNPRTNLVNVILTVDLNWQTGSYNKVEI